MKMFIGAWVCSSILVTNVTLGADAKEDEAITQQVRAIFAKHPDLGTQVQVRTIRGVVYLDGLIATGLEKTYADSLAQSVQGVKKVVDNIGVTK